MNYQNVTLGLLKDSDIAKEAFKIMFPDMYMQLMINFKAMINSTKMNPCQQF